jgi:hypothetical protein
MWKGHAIGGAAVFELYAIITAFALLAIFVDLRRARR